MPKAINQLLRRKSSSPFTSLQRTKPNARKSSLADQEEKLEEHGLIPSLAPKGVPQDVLSLLKHLQSHTFDPVPDRAAGMNSERISEVLRFRAALPPIISLASLYAISKSSTATERELARLIAEGKVRKLSIPGRGRGNTAVGDGIVLVSDWIARVQIDTSLEEETKEKYISLLKAHSASPTAPTTSLTETERGALVVAGFLTLPGASATNPTSLFTPPTLTTSLSNAGSTFAAGTLAATGGYGAVQTAGGGGSMLATSDNRPARYTSQIKEMTFALPSTGAYLKLLVAARAQFLSNLRALSPKYKEATLDVLKEKWNGNISGSDAGSALKKARGEWSGVLPGKTRRWKEFYGMRFESVLTECVGAGVVECFDTGAVGMAVRAR